MMVQLVAKEKWLHCGGQTNSFSSSFHAVRIPKIVYLLRAFCCTRPPLFAINYKNNFQFKASSRNRIKIFIYQNIEMCDRDIAEKR